MFRILQKLMLLFVFTLLVNTGVRAGEPEKAAGSEKKEAKKENPMGFEPGDVILDHIYDNYEWHFFDFRRSDGTIVNASICLPVITYTPGVGFNFFSFKELHHGPYEGFTLGVGNKIIRTDGKKFWDLSITKNVIQELIAVLLLLWIMISVARNYKKYGSGQAPRGLQSVVEVIVIFIRDQVAKPLLGAKTNKYLPYLLTIFFFIWINNMLGL